ncbi:hypothetical protein [Dyadobacter linearis]|nr:hypothetical protein [Dyadobacter sp. CECT 9623]
MEKHIKVNKPIPEAIRKALEEKRQWREKVRSGEYSAAINKTFKVAQ